MPERHARWPAADRDSAQAPARRGVAPSQGARRRLDRAAGDVLGEHLEPADEVAAADELERRQVPADHLAELHVVAHRRADDDLAEMVPRGNTFTSTSAPAGDDQLIPSLHITH